MVLTRSHTLSDSTVIVIVVIAIASVSQCVTHLPAPYVTERPVEGQIFICPPHIRAAGIKNYIFLTMYLPDS